VNLPQYRSGTATRTLKLFLESFLSQETRISVFGSCTNKNFFLVATSCATGSTSLMPPALFDPAPGDGELPLLPELGSGAPLALAKRRFVLQMLPTLRAGDALRIGASGLTTVDSEDAGFATTGAILMSRNRFPRMSTGESAVEITERDSKYKDAPRVEWCETSRTQGTVGWKQVLLFQAEEGLVGDGGAQVVAAIGKGGGGGGGEEVHSAVERSQQHEGLDLLSDSLRLYQRKAAVTAGPHSTRGMWYISEVPG
jgi:hypothetical protein